LLGKKTKFAILPYVASIFGWILTAFTPEKG